MKLTSLLKLSFVFIVVFALTAQASEKKKYEISHLLT